MAPFLASGELALDESELLLSDIIRFKEERIVSIYKKCRLPKKPYSKTREELSKTRLLAMHASASLPPSVDIHNVNINSVDIDISWAVIHQLE